MRCRLPVLPSLLACGVVLLCGCGVSEETGSGTHAANPQLPSAAADTAGAHAVRQGSVGKRDSVRTKRTGRSSPRFKARQDTVSIALVKRERMKASAVRKIVRPENPMYTVQVGAFSKAANALRAQKIAKGRFKDKPIFNRFDPDDKMYRVSVGKFDTGEDASAFRHAIMKQYSDEYVQCWIIYIAR